MTITKSEWEQFWKDIDEHQWYHDDDDVPPGVDALTPSDAFKLTCGVLCWQGSGVPKGVSGLIAAGEDNVDLIRTIRKWQALQDVNTIVVQVPKAMRVEFDLMIATLGVKVVK